MTPASRTCDFCGKPSIKKWCNRTCENRAWRRDNPEKWEAIRAEFNEKRRELRKTQPGYGRGASDTAVTKPSYIERIKALRDPETHAYRCMSAVVARDEQMGMAI